MVLKDIRKGVYKNCGGGTARGSDSGLRVGWSGRVMTEVVLCVWVRVGYREGKYGGDKGSKIANAKVNALRLREPVRRNYFSCARSGVFIGERGVSLKLLARDDRSWCKSCASVFLGARD